MISLRITTLAAFAQYVDFIHAMCKRVSDSNPYVKTPEECVLAIRKAITNDDFCLWVRFNEKEEPVAMLCGYVGLDAYGDKIGCVWMFASMPGANCMVDLPKIMNWFWDKDVSKVQLATKDKTEKTTKAKDKLIKRYGFEPVCQVYERRS
jgi:hypothetical protein